MRPTKGGYRKLAKDDIHAASGWFVVRNRTTTDYNQKEQCMLKGDSHIDTPAREHEEEPSVAHQRLSSRRTFLSGSAKLVGGGALALGLGAAPAFAKANNDDGDEDNNNKRQGGKRNNGGGVSDVDILNYALVLERLEYEFYRKHLQKYSKGQI